MVEAKENYVVKELVDSRAKGSAARKELRTLRERPKKQLMRYTANT